MEKIDIEEIMAGHKAEIRAYVDRECKGKYKGDIYAFINNTFYYLINEGQDYFVAILEKDDDDIGLAKYEVTVGENNAISKISFDNCAFEFGKDRVSILRDDSKRITSLFFNGYGWVYIDSNLDHTVEAYIAESFQIIEGHPYVLPYKMDTPDVVRFYSTKLYGNRLRDILSMKFCLEDRGYYQFYSINTYKKPRFIRRKKEYPLTELNNAAKLGGLSLEIEDVLLDLFNGNIDFVNAIQQRILEYNEVLSIENDKHELKNTDN